MNLPSSTATSAASASSPVASKSLGMPIASGKPDSKMRINQNSFDAASTSQVRLKDAYLGGLMEKQRRNPSHQEEEDSEDSDNPEAEIWYHTGKPIAQNSKAWEQPIAHGASASVDKEKVKVIQKRHGDITSKYRHTHSIIRKPSSPWSGKSMEDNLAIL